MKKTWLLTMITVFILVITACGKEEEKPSQVNGDSSQPPALLTLESDVSYDPASSKLSATVSMTNPNENAVDVTFNSSQRFQLTVMRDGETVFDYGSDYLFTEALVEETWEAGTTKVFDEVFPLELEAGEYTVEIVGLGQVEGAPEMAVTNQHSLQVEATSTEGDEGTAPQSEGPFQDVRIQLNEQTIQVTGFTDEPEFEWTVSDGHNIYAQGAAEVTGGGFTFGVLLDEAPTADQQLFLELTPIGGSVTSFRIQ
ncbi:BsuPI-related putative proteinase inhibitor [Exiguobacterium algae]|uniref:BsuPI-related putative proteinase inhibitor n=1 Tax=Exiguobacterium algae TaxID=2751250 RepID=UPI0030B86855